MADKVLTLILYVITVTLLFRTYSLQQTELSKMVDANKELVTANKLMVDENKKANELQLIITLKNSIYDRFNERKFDYDSLKINCIDFLDKFRTHILKPITHLIKKYIYILNLI
ncbi:hypothetical protein QYS47_01520 [Marivirga arenosa]|uniref:Uncharacterized protein n=2 Tax=Marivirga arenosa TaxID=3059076 RepID=A0AA49GG70_9BACT|nr:hypothetical protein QYS47_01520 [Marivirga sp. BKB1-2]